MTLGEAMRKTLELLDEYNDGSPDTDIEAKLPGFLDMAQKKMAQRFKITRTAEFRETEWELPTDCERIVRVWQGKKPYRGWSLRMGMLELPYEDEWTVEYFGFPVTIDENTEESHELEIREDAAQAMPFLAAGMVLSSDLVQDANIYLNMYQLMVDGISTEQGGGRIRQSLYRGRS